MTDKPMDDAAADELWKKMAKLYADSHEMPDAVSKIWPDQFADQAIAIIEPLIRAREIEAIERYMERMTDEGHELWVSIAHQLIAEIEERG